MEASRSSHCPDLPEDLIIDILLRLPVKPLLRFKSVCKNWFDLLESSNFINKHFHHEQSNYPTTPLVYCGGYRYMVSQDPYFHSSTLFPNQTLERHVEPEHLKTPNTVRDIRGPCKGVFCVHSRNEKLALWNPATRRIRPLPAYPKYFSHVHEIGFGVDPITEEFKVVVMDHTRYRSKLRPYFAVYTSANDCWRFVEREPVLDCGDVHAFILISQWSNTFLNGFYYWQRLEKTSLSCVILAFDMHTEVFDVIEMPDIKAGQLREFPRLIIYSDSLALVSHDGYDLDGGRIAIWVMKEKGCWIKLFSVVLPLKNIWLKCGIWKNIKICILNENLELILCDFEFNNTQNILGVVKRGVIPFLVLLFDFKESLISIKGGHEFRDYSIHSFASQLFFVEK